jgi:hypothetical protein
MRACPSSAVLLGSVRRARLQLCRTDPRPVLTQTLKTLRHALRWNSRVLNHPTRGFAENRDFRGICGAVTFRVLPSLSWCLVDGDEPRRQREPARPFWFNSVTLAATLFRTFHRFFRGRDSMKWNEESRHYFWPFSLPAFPGTTGNPPKQASVD